MVTPSTDSAPVVTVPGPASAAAAASDASSLFGHPVVIVAMRRTAALGVAALPAPLAQGVVAVTTVAAGAGEPTLPAGPNWIEIDPERGFRVARARLGGSLRAASFPVRVARIVRHPLRTVRRRSLYRRRGELRDETIAHGLRASVDAAAAGGPVTVVPLESADASRLRPLIGGSARLVEITLDDLTAAWEVAGRPATVAPTASRTATYDPASYWGRLHERHDLSAVGQSGLPPQINAWLYRSLARTLRGFLARHGVTRPAPATAFDIGVGTGYWVRFWRSLGVEVVDGCDLVPEAVELVRAETSAAGAKGTYTTADIGVEGGLPAGSYGAVSCMNVLLHLTDDDAFDRALAAIAGLVGPGGVLVLAEPMLIDAAWERPHDPSLHSRARSVARYRRPLEVAGLVLEDLRAGTVLANNPLEAGSRRSFERYARWWRWVASESKANPQSARWLGPLVMGLDRVALRTGAAPSTKLALFRRPAEGTRR